MFRRNGALAEPASWTADAPPRVRRRKGKLCWFQRAGEGEREAVAGFVCGGGKFRKFERDEGISCGVWQVYCMQRRVRIGYHGSCVCAPA